MYKRQRHRAALVSHAKLACADAAWTAGRKGIQVHGAMGYTWEVDLQMFMKRAWVLDAAWGLSLIHIFTGDKPFGLNFHMFQPNAQQLLDLVLLYQCAQRDLAKTTFPEYKDEARYLIAFLDSALGLSLIHI